MSELRDRFERLATRGQHRGAPAVIRAATADAALGARRNGDGGPDGEEPLAVADLGGTEGVRVTTDDVLPVVAMEEVRRTRRPYRTVLAAAGMAALLGVGTLAISALDAGGAGSPEDALRQLADAVNDEDLLAAVDVLAPAEVASLDRTVDEASRRAAELGLVGDATAPLQGVDLRVDDLAVRSEELAPGFAKVTITGGSIAGEVRGDEMSGLLREVGVEDSQLRSDFAELRTDEGVDPFVMAIEHDGGWYVSPAYTVLEYIRVLEGLPAAELGSGRAAAASLGADSPDAAVRDAAEALAAGDWARVIELVPPDEIPVYDYRAGLAEVWADTEFGFTIDELTTDAEVDGDVARVTVQASGAAKDDPDATWTLDEQCLNIDGDPEEFDGGSLCGPGRMIGTFFYWGGPSSGEEIGALRATVVQRDGRWFVSPVESVLDMVRMTVAELDEASLYALLGLDHRLEPTGAITLGEEVTGEVPALGTPVVYTFEGRAGQEVVGTTVYTEDPDADPYLSTPTSRIFGPDGTEIGEGGAVFYGFPVELPADGTYTLSLRWWQPGEFRFTLHDAADAPPDALAPPDPCAVEGEVSEGCEVSDPSLTPLFDFDEATGEACFLWADGSQSCGPVGDGSDFTAVDPVTGGTCTAVPFGDGYECEVPGGAFGVAEGWSEAETGQGGGEVWCLDATTGAPEPCATATTMPLPSTDG